jgi:muramoyltetrapeptide carboxypeptidase LdcA involved in peptidoglycan recycling
MSIHYPKPLVPGDLIAITAPSAGVPAPLHRRLDRAIDTLRQRGYRVVEGECLRQQNKQASSTPELRAAELMKFLLDPEVAAVMPPWGGELAIELLHAIDFQALSNVPAKWFIGFSDLSTLHLPLTTISGWATLHGPNLMELGAATTDEVTAAIWSVLAARHQSVTQISSKMFQHDGPDWSVQPSAGLALTEETQWKRLDESTAPVELAGRLIGGCLDTIARLAGTPYGDIPSFVKASQGDGVVLYIENAEMKPCELVRALFGLHLNGWFEGLNGILIGRSAAPDAKEATDLTYREALRSAFGGVSCPVLYDLDIGHVPPQFSLVNGALAKVQFHGGAGSIVQSFGVEPGVPADLAQTAAQGR